MAGDRKQRVQDLFFAALEIDRELRDDWLKKQCADDYELQKEVESLLQYAALSDDPLEHGLNREVAREVGLIEDLHAGLHVRCPHCHQPIEIVEESSLSDVVCSACGSNFSLISSEDTQTYHPSKDETVGHFNLVDKVGVGAFGNVYRAYDKTLDRTVAVKIPRKGQLLPEETEQFLREARTAAQLRHPGIVSVHEVGRDGDRIFIVSDFIDGLTLSDYLTGMRPTVREAVELAIKVARSLHYAHEQGVIHRDLKPGNIMLDRNNEPHLMDFGLAKREAGEITITMDGQVLGTPAYMSPEQARGEGHHADRRSDIHALGVILFELLTGERPFRGNTRMLLHQLLTEDAPSPRRYNANIPRDMETICLKCLEKNPDRRYQTAGELADDLQRFLDHRPILARSINRLERTWRWCRRKPIVASLLATVFVLLATVGIVSSIAWLQTSAALYREGQALNKAQAESQRARDETTRAEAALQKAEVQRQRAEATLLDMYESFGMNRAHQDEHAEALLWFAKVADAPDATPERRRINQMRLRNWLRRVPVPVYFVSNEWGRVEAFQFHPSDSHLLIQTSQHAFVGDLEESHLFTLRSSRARFSPDGKILAVGNQNGQIKLHSFPSMAVLDEFNVSGSGIPQLAFSDDGKLLAAGSQDLHVWDLTSRSLLSGIANHPQPLHSVQFSDGGRFLVTACKDSLARIYEIDQSTLSEQPAVPPIDHRSRGGIGVAVVPPLIVSSESAIFLKGGHELNLVHLESGEVIRTFQGGSSRLIANAVLTSDRKKIVITTDVNAVVSVVEIATGKTLQALPPADDRVPSLAVAANSQILATGSHDSFVRLYDPNNLTTQLAAIDLQGIVDQLAVSNSGQLLVTQQLDSVLNSNQSVVKVYRIPEVSSGPDVDATIHSKKFWLPHESTVSADGAYSATPGARWQAGPGAAYVYDTQTMLPVSPELTLNAELTATALNVSGDTLVTLTTAEGKTAPDQNGKTAEYMAQEGVATLWDWRAGKGLHSLKTESVPLDAAFNPDGSRLVIVCGLGHVLLVEPETMQVRASMIHEGSAVHGFQRRRRMIRFHPFEDQFCTLGIGSSICLWNTDGTLKTKLTTTGYFYDAQYSPDGKYLATATDKGEVAIWDVQTGKPAAKPLPHSAQVWQVNFDRTGTRLVTACEDRMARVWDWSDGKLAGPGLEHDNAVRFADFVSDDRIVVTGSQKAIRFWDVTSGREIAPPRRHEMRPESFVLAGNRQMVVGPGAAFWLTEVENQPNEIASPGALLLAAEATSGRRIERNGTVSLSSNEWMDTLRRVREAGETPYELLGGRMNPVAVQIEQRLRSLWQTNQWQAAVEFLKSISPEEVNEDRFLIMATEACVRTGEFEGARAWMNRLPEIIRQTEGSHVTYVGICESLRHPELQVEYRHVLKALSEHTNPDQRLMALGCLSQASVTDTSSADLAMLLLTDSDATVRSTVQRLLTNRLADDRTGRWIQALNQLPEEIRRLFDEQLKLANERVIEEPAILALLGQSDEWEWSVPEPLAEISIPMEWITQDIYRQMVCDSISLRQGPEDLVGPTSGWECENLRTLILLTSPTLRLQ
ncbi:MAG: protein kinase [Planctomycetaceae bacterium]|nr:protein kinase [Planctomycetaceae bacterium]